MKILGLGTAVPARSLTQDRIAEMVRRVTRLPERESRVLRAVFRRAGVSRRGSVLLGKDDEVPLYAGDHRPGTRERMEAYDRLASGLAMEAAQRALAAADCPADEITHLVTASCTGFSAPGVDLQLVRMLPLQPTVERTHVGFMGCHAALNALRVAAAIAQSDARTRVLVCAVELSSLHLRYDGSLDEIVSSALFADGAGAAVVGAGDGPWRIAANGSCLLADTEDLMSWRIGDHGFEMGLGADVPKMIEEHAGGFVDEWLAARGRRREDVRTWALHPGGPRILAAAEAALGADASVSREVLAEHGNMSSATLLFVLERLRAADAPLPLVAVGFGPGLTVETALIE
jgi:predicted naringenin-chalcone synthase